MDELRDPVVLILDDIQFELESIKDEVFWIGRELELVLDKLILIQGDSDG